MKTIFITGGTGYIGKKLTQKLLERGHQVIVFVRPGSESKVPAGATAAVGDPFSEKDLAEKLPAGSVFVQLLGVPHPSPKKKDLFYKIDLQSVKASAAAAAQVGVANFIYVSVAMEPSGIMADYQKVRQLGEAEILEKRLPHVFLRPWYVVGPGHWWPVLLWPVYKILEIFPSTRRKALAFGLVSIGQMLDALVVAVEMPEGTGEILEVEMIRKIGKSGFR